MTNALQTNKSKTKQNTKAKTTSKHIQSYSANHKEKISKGARGGKKRHIKQRETKMRIIADFATKTIQEKSNGVTSGKFSGRKMVN